MGPGLICGLAPHHLVKSVFQWRNDTITLELWDNPRDSSVGEAESTEGMELMHLLPSTLSGWASLYCSSLVFAPYLAV